MRSTRSTSRLCYAGGRGRKRSPRWNALAAVALSAAIAGCAAESELLREDPGFTAASLRDGGLAVLGVVQVDEVPQVRPPLIAALETVLGATRGDVPLVPASRVEGALPDSAYRLLLLGYQMHGEPDSLWLAAAARAVRPLARYGVLARVESASVRFGTRYVYGEGYGTGEEYSVHVTGRDAHLAVDVYDLETRHLVFRGKYIGSSDAAETPRTGLGDDSLGVRLPRKPILTDAGTPRPPGPGDDPAAFGYPGAPPIARAAEAAFVSFAQALPGAESAPATGRGR